MGMGLRAWTGHRGLDCKGQGQAGVRIFFLEKVTLSRGIKEVREISMQMSK